MLIVHTFHLHKKLGRNKWILMLVGFLSTVGLTFEIYVILLTNLHQGFLSTSSKSFLSHLFFRPLIMASLLVGIDLIIQKLRNDKKELLDVRCFGSRVTPNVLPKQILQKMFSPLQTMVESLYDNCDP